MIFGKKKNKHNNDEIFLIDDIIISNNSIKDENSELSADLFEENIATPATVTELFIAPEDEEILEVKPKIKKNRATVSKKRTAQPSDEIASNRFPKKTKTPEEKTEQTFRTESVRSEENDTDDFINSLNNLTAKEIPKRYQPPKKKKSSPVPALIRSAMLLICGGVFIYSAIQIIASYADSIKSQKIQLQIKDQFYKNSEITAAKASLKSSKTLTLTEMLGADTDGIDFIPPELLDEYQTLIKGFRDTISSGKYPDAYGWVKIPGTRVDYIIMLGKDNDQYLKRSPDGSYNEAGSVFADFRTAKDYLSNRHVVLYGHNRSSDGTMFNSIASFFNSTDSWTMFNSSEIQIVTADGLYIYKPFSLYITSESRYIEYNFRDDNDWVTFLQERLDLSKHSKWTTSFKSYIKPTARILTFSTCTNNFFNENERYVMHCVLTKIVTE